MDDILDYSNDEESVLSTSLTADGLGSPSASDGGHGLPANCTWKLWKPFFTQPSMILASVESSTSFTPERTLNASRSQRPDAAYDVEREYKNYVDLVTKLTELQKGAMRTAAAIDRRGEKKEEVYTKEASKKLRPIYIRLGRVAQQVTQEYFNAMNSAMENPETADKTLREFNAKLTSYMAEIQDLIEEHKEATETVFPLLTSVGHGLLELKLPLRF